MEEKTVFQKIIEREIPATILYEDDLLLAFLDIHPVNKGHALLITKTPYRWMTDVPDEILGTIFEKAKKIMSAQIKGLGCDFVQVGIIGKDVPHFHIHLIPRTNKGDDIPTNIEPKYTYEEGEKEVYAEKIKSAL